MKRKYLLWIATSMVIILTSVNLKLRLKYEVDFFKYEKFIHEKPTVEDFEFHWPEGKKMALSLTFDDARLTQIDSGIPILDNYDVKATFYVSLPGFQFRLNDWKKAQIKGHEIGNHTITHPCSINYDWSHKNSLENYTMTRMFNDINNQNEVLNSLLGFYPKSFAYPCGQTFIGEGINTKSYVPLVSTLFESGRLYSGGTVHPVYSDLAKLPSESMDNVLLENIIHLIEEAKKTGKWLILTGHEVGNESNLQTTNSVTLDAICRYAKDTTNGIWIDNVHNIASYIKEKRGEEPFKYISNYKRVTSSIYGKIWALTYIWKMKLLHYKNTFMEKFQKS